MLLEKDRIKQEQDELERRKDVLEESVRVGKSAERLLNNTDWQRLASKIEKVLEEGRKNLNERIASIIVKSDTSSEKDHIACNEIRKAVQEITDLEFMANLPREEARVGEEAEKELSKLSGEERKNVR